MKVLDMGGPLRCTFEYTPNVKHVTTVSKFGPSLPLDSAGADFVHVYFERVIDSGFAFSHRCLVLPSEQVQAH